MSYFTAYLVVGLILLLIHQIWFRLSGQHRIALSQSLTPDHRPKWRDWRNWIQDKEIVWDVLKGVLFDALLWASILLLWPVPLIMFVHEKCFPTPPVDLTEKKFEVVRENLIQPMTIDLIEKRERIFDPLGAVPDLPFGHLNSVWLRFKTEMQDGDAIWSFSARWTSGWGNSDIREGYVILRDDSIGPFFITGWQDIEDVLKQQKERKRSITTWLRKQAD